MGNKKNTRHHNIQQTRSQHEYIERYAQLDEQHIFGPIKYFTNQDGTHIGEEYGLDMMSNMRVILNNARWRKDVDEFIDSLSTSISEVKWFYDHSLLSVNDDNLSHNDCKLKVMIIQSLVNAVDRLEDAQLYKERKAEEICLFHGIGVC